jgi:hypothetical protein
MMTHQHGLAQASDLRLQPLVLERLCSQRGFKVGHVFDRLLLLLVHAAKALL